MSPAPGLTSTYRAALITGASSGIGRGLALWFARHGVTVYAAARRQAELEALSVEVASSGMPGRVLPVVMDVADTGTTRELIRAVDDRCGGLDLVVANAAVALETPAQALEWSAMEAMIDVNVRGAAATLTAVVDRFVARGAGQLVGISSLAAARGAPRNAGYSASKAFLSTFLEGLRVDLRSSGIAVTAIHPGFVRTPGTAQNTFEMPFLLECDDAVERIGQAILRRDAEFSFPWQAAWVTRISRLLPNAVWDRTAAALAPGKDD